MTYNKTLTNFKSKDSLSLYIFKGKCIFGGNLCACMMYIGKM